MTLSYYGNVVMRNGDYHGSGGWGDTFANYPPPPYTGFKEQDLFVYYEDAWRNVYFKPMVRGYTGSRPDLAFREPFYGQASAQLGYLLGPAKIYTIQTADLNKLWGSYFGELGVSWQGALGKGSWTAATEIGWGGAKYNLVYIGLAKTALNLFQASLSYRYPLAPSLYLRPHLEYSRILDNDLRALLTPPETADVLNVGLALGLQY